MSYNGSLQNRARYVKCPMCGGVANGSCKGCEYWFCQEHIYRHNNCQEGR